MVKKTVFILIPVLHPATLPFLKITQLSNIYSNLCQCFFHERESCDNSRKPLAASVNENDLTRFTVFYPDVAQGYRPVQGWRKTAAGDDTNRVLDIMDHFLYLFAFY